MSVVSINFTKVLAERNSSPKGKVNVSNNVAVKDINKFDFVMGTVKQNCLKINFEFTSKTEPSMGGITIEGDVVYLADDSVIEETLTNWKEKKPINKDLLTSVLNTVLRKCNIEALVLSQTMNLPAPIKLPSVTSKEANTTTKN